MGFEGVCEDCLRDFKRDYEEECAVGWSPCECFKGLERLFEGSHTYLRYQVARNWRRAVSSRHVPEAKLVPLTTAKVNFYHFDHAMFDAKNDTLPLGDEGVSWT